MKITTIIIIIIIIIIIEKQNKKAKQLTNGTFNTLCVIICDVISLSHSDGGDKDSRDLLQMRLEEQWRKGNDIALNKIGGFEKHTRGFGSQLMRKQGWKEGGSLGSSQVGIKEPVVAEGQFPKCKRGLGYYGEKLQRHVKRPRAEKDVIIATIYDEPDSQEDNLFESWGPNKLKYVNSVDFVRGKPYQDVKRKR